MTRIRNKDDLQLAATMVTDEFGGTPTSQNHWFVGQNRCEDEVHKDFPNSGGPCWINRVQLVHNTPYTFFRPRWPGGAHNHSGTIAVNGPFMIPGSFNDLNGRWWNLNMDPYLVEGYNRVKPGKGASLGVSIAELRDLPRLLSFDVAKYKRLWRTHISHRNIGESVQDAANAYLQLKFGWEQVVRDLQSLYNTWHTLDAKLAQLARDRNRWVRRATTLRTSSNSHTYGRLSSYSAFSPAPYPTVFRSIPTYDRQYAAESRINYVAKFKYDFPQPGLSYWTPRAKGALFGVLPTPDLVWNVLPWSWLIDWFVGIGPVLDRLSITAVDNLRTGYEFATFEQEASYTLSADAEIKYSEYLTNGVFYPVHAELAYRETLKQRQGTVNLLSAILPVEFNLDLYQLAILNALVISKT